MPTDLRILLQERAKRRAKPRERIGVDSRPEEKELRDFREARPWPENLENERERMQPGEGNYGSERMRQGEGVTSRNSGSGGKGKRKKRTQRGEKSQGNRRSEQATPSVVAEFDRPRQPLPGDRTEQPPEADVAVQERQEPVKSIVTLSEDMKSNRMKRGCAVDTLADLPLKQIKQERPPTPEPMPPISRLPPVNQADAPAAEAHGPKCDVKDLLESLTKDLISSDDDAAMALQVSKALASALLKYRSKSVPKKEESPTHSASSAAPSFVERRPEADTQKFGTKREKSMDISEQTASANLGRIMHFLGKLGPQQARSLNVGSYDVQTGEDDSTAVKREETVKVKSEDEDRE